MRGLSGRHARDHIPRNPDRPPSAEDGTDAHPARHSHRDALVSGRAAGRGPRPDGGRRREEGAGSRCVRHLEPHRRPGALGRWRLAVVRRRLREERSGAAREVGERRHGARPRAGRGRPVQRRRALRGVPAQAVESSARGGEEGEEEAGRDAAGLDGHPRSRERRHYPHRDGGRVRDAGGRGRLARLSPGQGAEAGQREGGHGEGAGRHAGAEPESGRPAHAAGASPRGATQGGWHDARAAQPGQRRRAAHPVRDSLSLLG